MSHSFKEARIEYCQEIGPHRSYIMGSPLAQKARATALKAEALNSSIETPVRNGLTFRGPSKTMTKFPQIHRTIEWFRLQGTL